jgi:hypothetical protein
VHAPAAVLLVGPGFLLLFSLQARRLLEPGDLEGPDLA